MSGDMTDAGTGAVHYVESGRPTWRNARCRCGHREALHHHPLWFWRWWAKRPRTPFACTATIWNMAHTDERRCVCTGFRAVHIGGDA